MHDEHRYSPELSQILHAGKDVENPDLHWGRAAVEGMPFHGSNPPAHVNGQFSDSVAPRNYIDGNLFDLSNEEDRTTYFSLVNRIANGWGGVLKQEYITEKPEDGKPPKIWVYLEYNTPVQERV